MGLLVLTIISTINLGSAYALDGDLEAQQRVITSGAEFGKFSNNEAEIIGSANIDVDSSSVVVGNKLYTNDQSKTRTFIIKYANNGSDSIDWQAESAQIKVANIMSMGQYIIIVGADNSGGTTGLIELYDLNGNLLDYYPNSSSSIEAFDIGKYSLVAATYENQADSFIAVNGKTAYHYNIDTTSGNAKIVQSMINHQDGTSEQYTKTYDDDVIFIDDAYVVTSKKIIYKGSPYWEAAGNFTSAQRTFAYNLAVLEGNNTVKMYRGETGEMYYQTIVPNAELTKLYRISPFSGDIFAVGRDTTNCDIGGLYNRNSVLYYISNAVAYEDDGQVAYKDGVIWKKSIYNAVSNNKTFSSYTISYTNPTRIMISGITPTDSKIVTTFYNQNYTSDTSGINVDYVFTTTQGDPEIVNCGVTNIEEDIDSQNHTKFYPTKASTTGFTFDGWYTDAGRQNAFVDGSTVATDTTLYAKWNRNVYDVEFRWDDYTYPSGANLPATQHIAYQSSASEPQITGDTTGYTFAGWHINNCANPVYDFTAPVISNLRLVGCWSQGSNTVTFVVTSTDNPASYRPTNAFDSKTVASGNTFTLPNPRATDEKDAAKYTFNGWYTEYNSENGELTSPYTSGTPVNSDITLYGAWINHTAFIKEGENGLEIDWKDNDGSIRIDEDGNIILDGFTGPGIEIDTDQDVTVIVENESVVGLACLTAENSKITITGEGSLTSLCIEGEDVVIDSANEVTALSIEGTNTVTITDSNVNAGQITSENNDITIKDSVVDGIINDQGTLITSQHGDIVIDNSEVSTVGLITEDGDIRIVNGSQVSLDDTEASSYDITGMKAKRLIVEDSNLNVLILDADSFLISEGIIEDGDSVVNIKAKSNGLHTPLLWVKNGDMNIESEDEDGSINYVINSYLTQIDDGTLTVKGSASACSVTTLFARFNGGKTNITNDNTRGVGAVCSDLVGVLEGYFPVSPEVIPYIIDEIGQGIGVELKEGEYIVFNGGDTNLNNSKSGMFSAVVIAGSEEDGEGTIKIAEDMLTDPEDVELDGITVENTAYAYSFYKGKASVDENGAPANLASKVRVYAKPIPPVPKSDEEDVPDTLDFQLIGLAGAVFIALMVEGMIIADLYRRLHGYEEEINQFN
ncbi:InlB B-repeat-containing protein [Candidatus Saccharibacteria bacterium]|nr:InlB B-repeat-containing protein [Candidatus Saccharibacteria bacterium]